LLLRDYEFGKDEILVLSLLLCLVVLLSECTHGQALDPAKQGQEVFADDFLEGGLGTCIEKIGFFEL